MMMTMACPVDRVSATSLTSSLSDNYNGRDGEGWWKIFDFDWWLTEMSLKLVRSEYETTYDWF